VITGGTSLMKGMVELGEEVFHMPVRVGLPQYAGALAEVVRSPRHSTGMGLLMAGLGQVRRDQHAKITGRASRTCSRRWGTGSREISRVSRRRAGVRLVQRVSDKGDDK